MSDGFTIAAASGAPTLFPCPACNETIDSIADTCRFCGQEVDHESAQLAAVLLAKINQACSDGSYLKSTAMALPVFFALRFVPIFSGLGSMGFIGLLFFLPAWSLRWWIKSGRIVTTDSDFCKTRRTVRNVGIVTPLLLVLFLAIQILVIVMRTRN
jgi:hypothetical protein